MVPHWCANMETVLPFMASSAGEVVQEEVFPCSPELPDIDHGFSKKLVNMDLNISCDCWSS